MGRVTVRRPVLRLGPDGEQLRPDVVAAEEPLQIRVDGRPLAVTMRTPGHDVELAHGFLLSEGVIGEPDDVRTARYCDGVDADGRNTYNVLDVALAEGVPAPQTGVGRMFSTSGVCGTAALDAIRLRTRYSPAADPVEVRPEVLATLPDALRDHQRAFSATGGLHAAGLFTADGAVLVVREDVDRHNAVDKVLGWALLAGRMPVAGACLMVSERASFDVVRKAAMAGVPVVASVSVPSSLAVDLAEEQGITLVGSLRGASTNVYAGTSRVCRSPIQSSTAGHRP